MQKTFVPQNLSKNSVWEEHVRSGLEAVYSDFLYIWFLLHNPMPPKKCRPLSAEEKKNMSLFRYGVTSSKKAKAPHPEPDPNSAEKIDKNEVKPAPTGTRSTVGAHRTRLYCFQSTWKAQYPSVQKLPRSHVPPSQVYLRVTPTSQPLQYQFVRLDKLSDEGGTRAYAVLK